MADHPQAKAPRFLWTRLGLFLIAVAAFLIWKATRPTEPEPLVFIEPGIPRSIPAPPGGRLVNLLSAPAPSHLGIYRPNVGFLSQGTPVRIGPETPLELTDAIARWASVDLGTEWIGQEDLGADLPKPLQVDGFDIAWCSSAPISTGTVYVSFYAGHALGDPPSGYATPLAQFTLEDLPMGGPNGETRAWRVSVDLSGGSEFLLETTDGLFSWGFSTEAQSTGPYLLDRGEGHNPQVVVMDTSSSTKREVLGLQIPGAGMALALHAEAPSTLRIYPGEGLPYPTLKLVASPVKKSAKAWWRILGANPEKRYFLWISHGPGEGEMDGFPVLVDTNSLLYNPVPMPQGELALVVPTTIQDSVWVQASEADSNGHINAVSNGLHHKLD